jgi:acyl-CoA thioesterase FadM
MNLLFRLFWLLISSRRRPRLDAFDESVLRLMVLPTDLDLNFHLNNGRLLSLFDLGRVDLLLRLGAVPALRRNRWSAVVASVAVRYRRPLNPLRRFELRTRTLCWDERWFFLEQRITRRGELMVHGVVKTQFFGPDGRVAPQALVDAVRAGVVSPPVPEAIRAWEAAEHRLVLDAPDPAAAR